jgi:hypothetical protein
VRKDWIVGDNHAYKLAHNLLQPAHSIPGRYDRGGVMPNLSENGDRRYCSKIPKGSFAGGQSKIMIIELRADPQL